MSQWAQHWSIRDDTIYLNHGSFGPTPLIVQERQRRWQQRMVCQPMDFFVRQHETAWLDARAKLAAFVGAEPEHLVFVENATAAMNTVAGTVRLQPGDEVLLTDHEYGAVLRIWRRACEEAGAAAPRIAPLPQVFESADQVVDAVFAQATDRTRLMVVSHVTSPTAVVLPVAQICRRAASLGIAVCIDGPHAPAQAPLDIANLECDFYTASLHKWLSAPLGSGFLYVSPQWHDRVRTPQLSWGRLLPDRPEAWWQEYVWSGTRDSSPYFASPAAIGLLEQIGLDVFRGRCHGLAREVRQRIVELTGIQPPTPDSDQWYGCMASMPLPDGDAVDLQQRLWQRHRIEVPIVQHNDSRSIRVSCHLYNTAAHIDALLTALHAEL